MEDRIRVSTELLESWSREIRAVQTKLFHAISSLNRLNMTQECGGEVHILIHKSLKNGSKVVGTTVSEVLDSMKYAMDATAEESQKLSERLRIIADRFQSAEQGVAESFVSSDGKNQLNIIKGKWDSFTKILVQKTRQQFDVMRKNRERKNELERREANQAKVFDSKGQYGSDQGGPYLDRQRREEFAEIIRKNTGKRLTDKELDHYLKRLNNEGCGYSSIINSIFRAYEGRTEDFKKTFGFEMYRDGDLDYNRLLVEVYSKTDNHNRGWFGKDNVNKTEDRTWSEWFGYNLNNDDSGYGMNFGQFDYRMELYLKEHGIENISFEKYGGNEITVDNYNEHAQKGEVVVLTGRPFTIYDSKGTPLHFKGGHFMTITGVENGKFKVSSWGKEYYLDPKDSYGFRSFQIVSFEA